MLRSALVALAAVVLVGASLVPDGANARRGGGGRGGGFHGGGMHAGRVHSGGYRAARTRHTPSQVSARAGRVIP